MKHIFQTLLVVCLLSASAIAQIRAEQPRVYLDTSYTHLAARTFRVNAGDNLQLILDVAQPGDTVEIQAGATFKGQWAIRNKLDNGKTLVIRSSAIANLPPEGVRVGPANSAAMPKLIPLDTGFALDVYPTYGPAGVTKARNVRFIGIEIAPNPAFAINFGLIKCGTNGSWQTAFGQEPTDITFDRCYVHGLKDKDALRGFSINSSRTAIIDSYISDFHVVGNGDTQAILIANAPGPLKIVRNYIEAAGENLMSGGLDVRIPGLVPSDIEIRDNDFVKPLSWNPLHASYAGPRWGVKNLFELKNAQRVLIEGNRFTNCWVDGQVGFAVQLTPRNQDGQNPWAAVKDITLTNNDFINVAGGINILGNDDLHSSTTARRITIHGNRFNGLGNPGLGNNGRWIQLLDGTIDISILNNSCISLYLNNTLVLAGRPLLRFTMTDNIVSRGLYGVSGDNTGEGRAALNIYAPGALFTRNTIIGNANPLLYPSGNYFAQQ